MYVCVFNKLSFGNNTFEDYPKLQHVLIIVSAWELLAFEREESIIYF